MTRGSLGGGVARGTLRWSVAVLRNGARAFGEATRSSPERRGRCFRVVVRTPTLSHSGSFRTEILDSRAFDLFAFARFFHAESSLEIPRKIETHNLLNLNRGNCPSRSEADPRGQSKARKRGDIADVRWERRTPREAPFRGISAHAFTPPPKPTNIKMACMSLSMKVAVAASECPRARSSLSATARVKSRVASNERLGRSRCARLARRAGESDASERREREIPRLTSLRAARLLSHPQSP